MCESVRDGCVAALPSGWVVCVGRYAAATERSGVVAKCLLLGNSTQGFPEECDNGRSFSFWKIISSMLIGSLFPADAACRVPTAFRDLGGWDAALAGSGFGAQKKGEAESLSLLLRGRLPTLPLSQYHRRGEA